MVKHTFHNGIYRTALLAVAAVYALGHIDIVLGRSPAAVDTLFSLDSDGLRRADGLAQLAGDAALLTRRVTAQRVLATEAGADGALLVWVVDCVSFRIHCSSAGMSGAS